MLALDSPEIHEIRKLSPELLPLAYSALIPEHRRPVSDAFWSEFNEKEQTIGYLACLLLFVLTGCDKTSKYGQQLTLCMVLPYLVAPETLSLVFSPLKHLQAVQVVTFQEYGINTIAINKDTPNNPDLWKDIEKGVYGVLVVQHEQLCTTNGHKPRLARLIDDNRKFAKLISRIHVDEAHFIYTAGHGHYGLAAFRPAWGRIGEFRVKIGHHVPTQALSGTQPEHIKAVIISSLLFDEERLLSIKLTSNRPNIVYATHPIVGELSDLRNLDFLVPIPYPADWIMPKTVVFHDSTDLTTDAAAYHNRRLPDNLQGEDLVAHYHGGMSKEYLTQVYDDFKNPDGNCRILHATEGASTACLTSFLSFSHLPGCLKGLDIPDIEVVIQYGISRDMPTTLQRGGRGGRGLKDALFLIMYEPWVDLIDLSEINFDVDSDPDHPNVIKLSPQSKKRERLGVAMIKIIQLDEACLRALFAAYLRDETLQDLFFPFHKTITYRFLPALSFTARWCCSRHDGTDFHLKNFFKGRLLYQDRKTLQLYYGDVDELDREEILPVRAKRKVSIKVRKAPLRETLVSRLDVWRFEAHARDTLRSVRPSSFIIDDKSIAKLARLHPTTVNSPAQITLELNETPEWQNEWSKSIFDVINTYDQELESLRKETIMAKKVHRKRARVEQDQAGFEEASRDVEHRIREEVTRCYAAEALAEIGNGQDMALRRSARIQK
ncbi:unnamed protein product [Cyclocybe aegerita]|uniref:DNA 3'-5' helicase n=1 Tax=Cyclocybe aegerita TaxID=1973307 RepID=A0A8S0WY15_CYCAE|nr:unnamed protein product [Cyclocybe aegerita]